MIGDVAAHPASPIPAPFGLGIVAPTGNTERRCNHHPARRSDVRPQAYITNATVGDYILERGRELKKATSPSRRNGRAGPASSVAVGFNSGSVGLNIFRAATRQGLRRRRLDHGRLDLTVNAKDSTGIASANGSGAYGSAVRDR